MTGQKKLQSISSIILFKQANYTHYSKMRFCNQPRRDLSYSLFKQANYIRYEINLEQTYPIT